LAFWVTLRVRVKETPMRMVGFPLAAAAAFWALTEAYLAERFGGHRPGAPRAALRTLRDTLRRR